MVEKLIKEAILLSRQQYNGGVRCLINSDGQFQTNYVPLREYTREHPFTVENNEFAIREMLDYAQS